MTFTRGIKQGKPQAAQHVGGATYALRDEAGRIKEVKTLTPSPVTVQRQGRDYVLVAMGPSGRTVLKTRGLGKSRLFKPGLRPTKEPMVAFLDEQGTVQFLNIDMEGLAQVQTPDSCRWVPWDCNLHINRMPEVSDEGKRRITEHAGTEEKAKELLIRAGILNPQGKLEPQFK